MKKTIISLSILFKVLTAQAIPGETQVPASSISGLADGLFDSEKLKIQQGFTLGTALMGNQSVSYGMLTNNFQLEVNPELRVHELSEENLLAINMVYIVRMWALKKDFLFVV